MPAEKPRLRVGMLTQIVCNRCQKARCPPQIHSPWKQGQNYTARLLGINPMMLQGAHSNSTKQIDQYLN